MKASLLALSAIGASSLLHFSTAATTPPYGYTTVTCLANSDTIVGLPMRQNTDFTGTLSLAPEVLDTGSPDFTPTGEALLTLSGTPGLTVDIFANTHYVKFKDTTPTPAAGDGQWFAITANTDDTITVDLNGGDIDALNGAALEVLKFWTLGELFPAADATTLPATTGNAIVGSSGTLPFQRGTELLYPDISATGINAGVTIYYIDKTDDKWKISGDFSGTDYSSLQLWPDIFFTIRHPSTVSSNTTYTVMGEVETGRMKIPLNSQASGFQDNYVAIPRPVDVTLGQLNLGGTSAFESSTGTLPFQRGDELFLYDNTATGYNKPVSIYYYNGNDSEWKLSGDLGAADRNGVVVPAGSGVVIRKKANEGSGEETDFWEQTPTY